MANITLAIDAMGGDHGPPVTVPAALAALQEHPELILLLVGNRDVMQEILAKHHARESEHLQIIHATQEVGMDELPSHALRNKKDSSMRVAIDLVKAGNAAACVSAGNTGALMATARFVLKMLPGVDRPAIMASLPTKTPGKEVCVLDLGANVDSCADHLYQFGVMGSVAVRAVENIERPRVALLNIGEEEIKGNDQVKLAAQLFSENPNINYIGYIEGDAIFAGVADVVVCDGFVGNIALKTSEGITRLLINSVREAFTRNWLTRLAGVIVSRSFVEIRKNLDPGRRNGASLLGLQGIVIKSHGGADARAYANAITQAVKEVEKNVPEKIRAEIGLVLEEGELP
ncbi:MAG: phosphate acyltransferase PlsX [Gammaproteobacteria bacterium]